MIWLSVFLLLSEHKGYGESPEPKLEKIYVQSHDILFHNDQIFVRSDQQWILAESIHTDAAGIYAKAAMLWFCKKCGYHNEEVDYCKKCGAPSPYLKK